MSEIKEQKPQGMMSKQTENEETSFMSRIIPDPEERRAAGQLVRKALTGFSTFIGNCIKPKANKIDKVGNNGKV